MGRNLLRLAEWCSQRVRFSVRIIILLNLADEDTSSLALLIVFLLMKKITVKKAKKKITNRNYRRMRFAA